MSVVMVLLQIPVSIVWNNEQTIDNSQNSYSDRFDLDCVGQSGFGTKKLDTTVAYFAEVKQFDRIDAGQVEDQQEMSR